MKIADTLALQVMEVSDGQIYSDGMGTVFLDVPRVAIGTIKFSFDECGVVCYFVYFIKLKNGHLIPRPDHCYETPEWVGEIEGKDPVLDWDGDKGDLLCWRTTHLIPFSNPIAVPGLLQYYHFRHLVETHVHVIKANQGYTKDWRRLIINAK